MADTRRAGAVTVERIAYQAGTVRGLGALVYDETITERRPLLLVAPNWLGVTDQAIARAQLMAGQKYVAFVADMYGDGKTCAGPPTAQVWMAAVQADPIEGRKRITAALQTMVEEVDKRGIGDRSHIAAVGFCFGGGNVLELARAGADLRAVVCVHGHLLTARPAEPGAIKAAIFVLHGTQDPVAPKADRDALEAELDAAGANWQLLAFGGRIHSFAEEETFLAGRAQYHAGAARQTYRLLDGFIQDAFAGHL
jgi:dienelactone hydrolase